MILYFADRNLNILGQASTHLPQGITISNDLMTEDVETGVDIFECDLLFKKVTRGKVEEWAELGNFILRSNGDEQELFTIIDAEIDTKKQMVRIYAEDEGLDLINDICPEYIADQPYPISHYVERTAAGSGWEIGINEVDGLTKQLTLDNAETASARLLKIAEGFHGCDFSFTFEIDGLQIKKKIINIYERRGKDTGEQLRLNKEIDSIITTKSIANLATALRATGGTPDDAENPITLKGYTFDDGDFYVDGDVVKSRKALSKWSRYLWRHDETQQQGGHIVREYSDESTSQAVLCANAIEELKTLCEAEINYEADIKELPDNVKIGDRVYIVDEEGELYIQSRILVIETSVCDDTRRAVLGEHLIQKDGISAKVEKLAKQFAKSTKSVARALSIANNAKANAEEAKTQAQTALTGAENAGKAADDALNAANNAAQSAQAAQDAANDAKDAVDVVENTVEGLQQTITNAQQAAENAYQAAETANQKADEAKEAAEAAEASAQIAKDEAEEAKTLTGQAVAIAGEAETKAGQAKTTAEAASEEAAAAKADAKKAEEAVDGLADNLNTLSQTMEADYTRKTEFTETTASLQSQISQNAGQISSTVSRLTEIDETANNAAELAETAQNQAEEAKNKANIATAEALGASQAAEAAALAAQDAQDVADEAKQAAQTAQGVADQAEADLEKAKADLATVSSRVDATQEDIEAAQQAVETAQAAADKAKADATAAATKANEAQNTANTAVDNAAAAQTKANEAANQATLAQQAADEAKGNAATAQQRAEQAANAAAEAQSTANAAVQNAATAQAKANEAAATASAAQQAADDADAKAAQAAADLATAQQNLADVVSRVDATQEEVEAAQAAVETAQAAADKAKADAQAAQSTADTAKADAATAQEAADTANAAAATAQQAAQAAQLAADKAQADVDALAATVTEQGTAINQKADAVELEAYKTEVRTTLGGYYTKTETDAAIKVSADAVTTTVTRTIDEMEIGARNLLPDTDFAGDSQRYERLEGYTSEGGFHFYPTTNIASGTAYTVSAKIRGNANVVFYEINEGGNVSHWWIKRADLDATEYRRFSLTFVVRDDRAFDHAYICTQWGDENTLVGDWFEIEPNSLKLEKGNKATDWTPAPEDVQDSVDEAQALADSVERRLTEAETQLIQLSDKIITLVRDATGESIMSQDSDSFDVWFDTTKIDKNISDTAEGLGNLEAALGSTQETVEALKSTLDGFQDRVQITTFENEPCIILYDETDYKKIITNTRCLQIQTTKSVDEIRTNGVDEAEIIGEEDFETLRKTRIEVEEAQIGQWVWKQRTNGNLCLTWESGVE